MSELPEIPEAENPFDKRVALTIAMLAVVLSFVENCGDNAKTDAIIKTNAASNNWAYYQAKSIKGQMSEMQANLIESLGGEVLSEKSAKAVAALHEKSKKYDTEKDEIKPLAEKLTQEAEYKGSINDRCDQAALMLQIAVVLCSVAILSKWKLFWGIGVALGIAGAVLGGMALGM